jgi:hypothetical protein
MCTTHCGVSWRSSTARPVDDPRLERARKAGAMTCDHRWWTPDALTSLRPSRAPRRGARRSADCQPAHWTRTTLAELFSRGECRSRRSFALILRHVSVKIGGETSSGKFEHVTDHPPRIGDRRISSLSNRLITSFLAPFRRLLDRPTCRFRGRQRRLQSRAAATIVRKDEVTQLSLKC